MAEPGRAGEVVPRTTVYRNTHNDQSIGFSQDFLNFLSGAPISRSEHASNEFENEQICWSNKSCVSDSVDKRSKISNGISMLSNVSQCEQKDVNSEFSNSDFPNVLNRQYTKFSNDEFSNVLARQNFELARTEH